MSDLVRTYHEHAQLSDAAYAELFEGMTLPIYIQGLRDRGFSVAEATEFANRYAIVSTFSNNLTGFSATLFQVTGTSEKILAIRGTDDWRDFLITDVSQIGLLGLANQYEDVKQFYLQLTIDGKLLSGDTLTVTGHSLGGYLAQTFAVDHPLSVSHAYTYNAPGFGGLLINPFGALGIAGDPVSTPLITNVIAQGQSFVASTGRQLGMPEHVLIETSLNPIANHGVRSLSDSLALYSLFATIDPSLDQRISTITEILNAASRTPSTSLENVLDALRTLFIGGTVTPTTLDNAAAYYGNLQDLKTFLSSSGIPLSGQQVVSLSNLSGGSMASLARQDVAYRYALNALNPFVEVA